MPRALRRVHLFFASPPAQRPPAEWQAPLWLRLLLPPLIVLIGLLGVSALLVRSGEAERAVNRDFIARNQALAKAAGAARQEIESVNTRVHAILLHRTIDDISDDEAFGQLGAIRTEVEGTAARLRQAAATDFAPNAAVLLGEIADRLNTYGNALHVVTTLFEGDMRSAVGLLSPFDRVFAGLNTDIDRILAEAEQMAGRAADEAARRTDRATRTSYLIVLATALASIVLAALFTKAIIDEILRLGAATRRLAEGDTTTPLDGLDRLPEFRPVVGGLRAFRRNLVEMTFLKEVQHQKELHEAAQLRAEAALAELKGAQARLVESEKMAALGGMVASIAHEINTPIGVSITAITTFERNYRALADAVAAGTLKKSEFTSFVVSSGELVDVLVRSLRRAGDLVRSFKMVALDHSVDDRNAFDLETYLSESLITIGPLFKKSPHRLVTEIESGIVMNSFPGALFQIVSNLVINALSHAFDDGRAGTIWLSAHRDGEVIILTCRDNGIGMTEEIRHRVFEPFFTTKRNRGGSGLGLSIVFRIATERLGGSVSVTSEPDRGTLFTLAIPRVAPDPPARLTNRSLSG